MPSFCYEINFSKINFIDENKKILRVKNPRTIISGSFKTGKKLFNLWFLSEFKAKRLYIYYSDFKKWYRWNIQNLAKFIKMNEIIVLVIENFELSIWNSLKNIILFLWLNQKRLKALKFAQLGHWILKNILLHDNKHQKYYQSLIF